MFGYVTASLSELSREQRDRYNGIYCGICRRISVQSGHMARLGLQYDMVFLAALLMSLYEPEEEAGRGRCLPHPVTSKSWVDNVFIRYAADMNVALSYYHFLDNWEDDGKYTAKLLADRLGTHFPEIRNRYPRQCQAIESCIRRLGELETEGCGNPDLPASCFGELMGELMVWEEDQWAPTLRSMGDALGRFVYLLDAVLDYRTDRKKGKYNPFLACGSGETPGQWEEYLLLTMGRCTEYFEKLPLVQDKAMLDNILYSGVWTKYAGRRKEEGHHD